MGLAFLFGLGMGLASPSLVSWMLAHTPLQEQAVALNTFYFFTEGSGFLGAWAFGLGLERVGLSSLFGLSALTFLGLAAFGMQTRRANWNRAHREALL